MRKYIYILIYVGCSLFYSIYSQSSYLSNPSLSQIAPPSPNASAFAKFGSIPIGFSTGIPQISIPLYTYENCSNGYKFSMNLDYHAGGIRVDEISSNIGIGWILNAGGVVSRNVRGIADDIPIYGFINDNRSLPQNKETANDPCIPPDLRFVNDAYFHEGDVQNDVFNFSFNNRNGKFVLGKNNDLLILNQDRIKIEKFIGVIPEINLSPNMIKKFKITDEKGFTYIFDDYEITTDNSIGTSAKNYISSWYLTKINSPEGKTLAIINYEAVNYDYVAGYTFTSTLRHPSRAGVSGLNPGETAPIQESGTFRSFSIKGKRLKKITFPNKVTVSFTYSTTERTDGTKGEFLLKKITLTDGTVTRGYKLNHDNSLNRPTLKSIIPFKGTSEIKDKGYEMTYIGVLPPRLSNKQDHWGFPNDNNGVLLPKEVIRVPIGTPNSYNGYYETSGGDRDTNPIHVKKGALQKIKYPTGGYTIFEMEANQAIDPRLNNAHSYTIEKFEHIGVKTLYCTANQNTTTTFTYTGDTNSVTSFKVTIPQSSYSCSSGVATCQIVIELLSPSGNILTRKNYNIPSTWIPDQEFTLSNLIPNTSYTIKTYTINANNNYFAYLNFQWKEKRTQNPVIITGTIGNNQIYVGGLRVKKITDYTADNVISSTKEYEYTLDNGQSSGTLGMYPEYTNSICYVFKRNSVFSCNDVNYESICREPNYLIRSTSTTIPLCYSHGSPVAYKKVTEKITSNNIYEGKIIRTFTSFENAPVIITTPFPYTPPEYKEWGNGLLLNTYVYDKNNKLLKKEENRYNNVNDLYYTDQSRFENFRSITIAPVYFMGLTFSQQVVYFLLNNFTPFAGHSELASTKITEYMGSQSIITELNYLYDPINFYIKHQTVRNSKNEIIKTELNYPKDMIVSGRDPNGIYRQMTNHNMINTVVERVQTNTTKSSPIKVLRNTHYMPFMGVYVPLKTEIQNGANTFFDYISFNKYSSTGNIIEQQITNGVKEIYVWAHNGEFLIAKVLGADYNTVYSLIDNTLLNNPSITNAQIATQLTNLRNGLSSTTAQVFTYSYQPLWGIVSSTDPRGITTYYEYDSFGRLQYIKDHNGKIIEQYNYNYRTP